MGSSYVLPYTNSNNHVSYRLPSIHSLSLDLPTYNPLPPLYQNGLPAPQQSFSSQAGSEQYLSPLPYLAQPQNSQTLLLPSKYGSSYYSPSNHLISPITSPHSRSVSSDSTGLNNLCNAANKVNEDLNVNRSRSASDPLRTVLIPPFEVRHNEQQPQSSQIVQPQRQQLQISVVKKEPTPSADSSTTEAETKKPSWKPRKKRQCPECKLFFSNLATHKSTHLKPASRPHVCKYCSRGFARPNDLFRHVKCHWKEIGSDKGQFKCPFKNHSTGDHCCHNSGIFSRCDTFKNHLKAIHFQYPNGTKKDQRNKVSGNCRMCQQFFNNVDDWLVNHVEKNRCPYGNELKKD